MFATRWARRWMKTYKAIGNDVIKKVRNEGMLAEVREISTKIISTTFADMYVDVGVAFAKDGVKMMKRSKAEVETDSRWVDDINRFVEEECAQILKSITETTLSEAQGTIKRIISNSIEQGLSIEDITGNIIGEFQKEWGRKAKWMARRIAQTETIRASNYGTKEGVDSLGIPYVKSWLAGYDAKVRETHRQAQIDNSRIPEDQPFIVGGFECDYPGDPNLPPEESVNCRCSWTAEPVD